jgi:alpha-L-rhamnosidase
VIEPGVVSDVEWANGTIDTRRGEVDVHWEQLDDGLAVDVTVPWNASATVSLPEGTVWESNRRVTPDESPTGIASVSEQPTGTRIEAGSGTYHFVIDETSGENKS